MVGPWAQGRPVENYYLVRERDRRRARELLVVLFVLVPMAVALLGYTWIHLEMRKVGYRIEEQEKALLSMQTQERRLRLEISSLMRPERIEVEASRRLGMAPPTLDQMIFLAEQ